MRARLQAIGAFLSGMIVPNIGALLAWGFITALFAPGGWLPNKTLAALISPMLLTLLPILIGFTGGRLVHGIRGGVAGAVATTGAIVGSDVPMFLGAMILGPSGGLLIRKVDEALAGRLPAALTMLAANFSAGLTGAALAVAALTFVGPAVRWGTATLAAGAGLLASSGLLALVAVVIEPAKVLFLNNAINHGLLAPLGAAEAHATGRSIFFLLETNPGPGLGVLLAYWMAGPVAVRESAPGAIIVHFFGGIHEVYFPYVLMQPLTILALIAGGLAANLMFLASGAGLLATPSPGSIFAELAMAPRGAVMPVLLGIAMGAVCACAVALPIIRRAGGVTSTSSDLPRAQRLVGDLRAAAHPTTVAASGVRPTIVFACDAGMGSSVLGAAVLARRLTEAHIDAPVTHVALADLSPSADIVVVHRSLADRARALAPRATIYEVDEFLTRTTYDALVEQLARDLPRRADAGKAHA